MPQHPGLPVCRTKDNLTALPQNKPLPVRPHSFLKYALLFWKLHVRFHAFFFLKEGCVFCTSTRINLTPVSVRHEAKNNSGLSLERKRVAEYREALPLQ